MEWVDGWWVLTSGRRFRAGEGMLGLPPDFTGPDDDYPLDSEVGIGFDERMPYMPEPFTRTEREEIAAAMILAWRRWAEG